MGHFLSSSNRVNGRASSQTEPDAVIAKLQDRLARLEALDADKNGEISKKEFYDWKNKQERDLQTFRENIIKQETLRYHKSLAEKDTELTRLREELQSLKTLLDRRGTEAQTEKAKLIEALALASSSAEPGEKTGLNASQALSEEQIRSFVEELLSDETINIGYLPDWVERQLYLNFFNLLIGLLRKTISTTSLQLIGHEIKLVMLPNSMNTKALNGSSNEDKGREVQELQEAQEVQEAQKSQEAQESQVKI